MKFFTRPVWIWSVVLLFILTACGPTAAATSPNQQITPSAANLPGGTPAAEVQEPPAPGEIPLSAPAEEDLSQPDPAAGIEIRRLMLNSHMYWNTVWMEVEISGADPAAGGITRVQVWVDQSQARFRVISGPADGNPTAMQVSDGERSQAVDYITGKVAEFAIDPVSLEPFTPPQDVTDTIYPHPLARQIESPVIELLFPTALAQRDGVFTLSGTETVAGRETTIVEFSHPNGQIADRLWVDLATGVILQRQTYDKSSAEPLAYYSVRTIVYDEALPAETFTLDITRQPVFSDSYDRLAYAGEWSHTEAAIQENGAYGDIYFVASTFGNLRLMRFSGECLALSTICPPAQVVPGYPNLNASINPLIWSADGTQAALIVGDRLYIYRPDGDAWLLLVRAEGMHPPVWSPDGSRLAFTSTENGTQSAYIIRPDGSEYHRLEYKQESTLAGEDAGKTGEQQMSILAWQGTDRLLVSTFAPGQRQFFTVGADDGIWTPVAMPAMGLKDYQVYSPTGSDFAQVSYIELGTRLTLASSDGSTNREVVTLADTSIWPVVWSPNGDALAFATYSSREDISAQVFVYWAEGTSGLDLVYSGGQVFSIHWSPLANTLLLETSQDGRSQLVAAVVETGANRIIQLEGIDSNAVLSGVSWSPPPK